MVSRTRGWAVASSVWLFACGFDPKGNEAGPELAGYTGDESGDGGAADEGKSSGDRPDASDDAWGDSSGGDAGDDPGLDPDPDPSDGSTSGGVENDCPRIHVSVSPGAGLNVRPFPDTSMEPIGKLPNNAVVDVLARVEGEVIDGVSLWFRIATTELEGYVFGAYAECTFEDPPDLLPPDGFWLPLECGSSATVSQGNFGSFSHSGNATYAFDFSLGIGTPMVAMADGIVIFTYADTMPGDPCYDGGDSSCYPYANLVTLLHGDGTTSIYKHLSDVWVTEGEFVPRGEVVGLSGSSGYSTGPHAHVMRQEDCGVANCQSVPLEFVDVGGGVPNQGDTVTSDNCP